MFRYFLQFSDSNTEGKDFIIKYLGRKAFENILCLSEAKGMNIHYEANYWFKQARGFAGSTQRGENNFSGTSYTNVKRRYV